MRLLATLSLLCISTTALAYSPLSFLPQGSRTSLLLESLNQSPTEIKLNTEQLYPPASTLKLVTALAAKLELGNDFQFSTSLSQQNNNVLIHFSGDPTLETKHLKQLLKSYITQSSRKIEGDVWLDNSAFTGYQRAVGWPWDILGVCYSAPATAITLDENCAQASIYTQENGNTRVYIPAHYPIDVSSQAATVTKSGQKATQCDLELTTSPQNEYQLSGCLIERDKPLPLKFAIQNPELYTKKIVEQLIKELRIDLKGEVRIGHFTSNTTSTLIAEHKSEKLPALIDVMLKKSDNLIADNLTKALGAKFFIQSGSFNNGTEAIKQILLSKANIDIRDAQLADGSGLSRNNRMTSEDMSKVLRYIWQNDQKLGLISAMPTSGQSGTLKYRSSMRKAPIEGHIIAKSGSLYGSYNMAGYGLNAQGAPTSLFVQFVSDYHPQKRDNDIPVIAPIVQFEKAFYKDIIDFSQSQ
ncbi:serine-type D-Ala-D-Ala carboxypeptidase [Vibrio sp. T187]|uniref:serine-type D-Ala-D-Ala carboxypeptidase n=1 Tax=Vibrio TaxID=662 RepID=UPI0010C972FB|nr:MULTISPECIES: serine-type D-Ala-D-Ala carboxypeptidase [Vibrio]MBW3694194.1 serine-type D-Ala-D-Ala carboxypeptidase [Vibrio sp. T187]